MMSAHKQSIFQRQPWVTAFAITAAVVWGWAYPLIKLGFAEFGITPDMAGSKMLFAGVRFTISGLIILAIARIRGLDFKVDRPASWWYIILFALLNTTLHYACFYFGLSYSAGSRSAILNSLGTFLTVIFACVFFKSDRFNASKVIGCLVGFTGIMALNMGGSNSAEVSYWGDTLIILNALCGAAAGLMTRGLGRRVNIFVGTGYGLAIGGALLIIAGVFAGGTLPNITVWGCFILLLLIGISSIGFTLYNKLLSCNPVGKVAIYNSLIPVVGAVTSCLCLGEPFYWKYLLSGALAALGIFIINAGKEQADHRLIKDVVTEASAMCGSEAPGAEARAYPSTPSCNKDSCGASDGK